MTVAELIQIILSFLSLIATIVLSIVLYILECKRYQREKVDLEKNKRQDLEHQAEIFKIKNGDEIDYLPLCLFANIWEQKKHKREIYNNFSICSKELQDIILFKSEGLILKIEDFDWIDSSISSLIADMEKYKLGRNVFYDSAKYVMRCFENYGQDVLPKIDTKIFELQDYVIRNDEISKRKIYKEGLYGYISFYLDFIEDIKKCKNPNNVQIKSPCDMIYNLTVNLADDQYCYWNAQLMRYLCSKLYKYNPHTRKYQHNKENDYIKGLVIELDLIYYEDLFYATLYELYLTYGNKQSSG